MQRARHHAQERYHEWENQLLYRAQQRLLRGAQSEKRRKQQQHDSRLPEERAHLNFSDEKDRQLEERIKSLTKKSIEKESIVRGLLKLKDDETLSRKEVYRLRKENQEQNMRQYKEAQQRYKSQLIDNLKEKQERASSIKHKKEKLKEFRIKNSINVRAVASNTLTQTTRGVSAS